jgi:protein-tyrosine phosphatase
MAEAVFKHLLRDQPDFTIDSRGTGAWHIGKSPDPRTVAACRDRGIACSGRGAQLTSNDFLTFDWLLVMDDDNLANATAIAPKPQTDETLAELRKLGDFDPVATGADLADPYYGGADGFPPLLEQTIRACRGFLKTTYDLESPEL